MPLPLFAAQVLGDLIDTPEGESAVATMLDHQVGLKQESTWNTPVVVDRFYEWLAGNGLDWDPKVVQGAGLRVGSQVARAARRVALVGQGNGKIGVELASKGLGTLLQGCWGTGASTLVSGSTYQQLFSAAVTGTYLPSYTVQEGIVKPGGTVDAYTFAGCSVTDFDVEMPTSGIGTLTVGLDARSLATGTALATASYPSSPTLYGSALPTSGALSVGGTLTVPTTTALASVSGGTNVQVKSWKLSVNNGLDTGRDVLGGRNQPVVGMREIKLSTVVEYDATTGTTLRDALIGQTSTPILITATTPETLAPATATLQLALPAAYIDKGAIPQPSDGKVITTSIEWSVLDPLTAAAAFMVLRTADTAL
jgi:hypothetical protein